MKNYAFTRQDNVPPADDAEIINTDYVAAIRKIKAGEGKDILAFGGVSFVASLIEAQLVDEYYLMVNPCILGKGKSIYSAVEKDQTLKLGSAKAYRCGVVVLHYLKK